MKWDDGDVCGGVGEEWIESRFAGKGIKCRTFPKGSICVDTGFPSEVDEEMSRRD